MSLKRGNNPFFYKSSLRAPEKISLWRKTDKHSLYKLKYKSVNNMKVPALFSIPEKFSPPHPTLLYLHYYRGNKESVELFLDDFAARGYAILAIDLEYHGERQIEGKDILSTDLTNDKNAFIQTIIDGRMGLDLLEAHPLVNKEKLGLLGVSLGSLIGVILSAVDKRIKAVVLVVGGGDMEIIIQKSTLDSIVNIREFIKKNQIDSRDLGKVWNPVEPLRYVQKIAPRPLLMLNGTLDTIIPPESSVRLFKKASEPKKIKWYNGGHSIIGDRNLGLTKEILNWFELHLKTKRGD